MDMQLNTLNILNLVISFAGLLINGVLVRIAYKAFKNFDVKKQFHNKQLDIVSELASIISSTILSNMMYETKTAPDGKEHQIATGFTLSFFEISMAFNYKNFSLICVQSNNIENTFPFLKYRNNPILPKKIANQLDKLYRPLQYSLAIQNNELPKNYVLLYPEKFDDNDFSKEWLFKFYESPIDFTSDCKELRKSIIEWFKEYGADNLNI